MNQQRRRILMHSATAVAVAALGLPEVSARAGGEEPATANIDVHIELHAMQDSVAIRPGAHDAGVALPGQAAARRCEHA